MAVLALYMTFCLLTSVSQLLSKAFWITCSISQIKLLCLYWVGNLKTKSDITHFFFIFVFCNQIQTLKKWHRLHQTVCRGTLACLSLWILNGDKWARFIRTDSVHYRLLWCSCDFIKIVVLIHSEKTHMWTACAELELELVRTNLILHVVILFRF